MYLYRMAMRLAYSGTKTCCVHQFRVWPQPCRRVCGRSTRRFHRTGDANPRELGLAPDYRAGRALAAAVLGQHGPSGRFKPGDIILVPVILSSPTRRLALRWRSQCNRDRMGYHPTPTGPARRSTLQEHQHRGLLRPREDRCVLVQVGERRRKRRHRLPRLSGNHNQ